MSRIERALVIKPGPIQDIREGKDWEIRGSRTKIRGPFAIAESGTGLLVATAELVKCIGPFPSRESFVDAYDRHRVTLGRGDGLPYGERTYAWVLRNTRFLAQPVPYRHTPGAVIWVKLDLPARAELRSAA